MRSKQSAGTQRSAMPGASPAMTNPLHGTGLAWPWAQQNAPDLKSAASNPGSSDRGLLEKITGALPGWLQGSSATEPDVGEASASSSAQQQQVAVADPPARAQALEAPVDASVGNASSSELQRSQPKKDQLKPVPSPSTAASRVPRSIDGQMDGAGSEAAVAGNLQRGTGAAVEGTSEQAAREEADMTSRLLEASGLPLRLSEDGLPEASTAAGDKQYIQGEQRKLLLNMWLS